MNLTHFRSTKPSYSCGRGYSYADLSEGWSDVFAALAANYSPGRISSLSPGLIYADLGFRVNHWFFPYHWDHETLKASVVTVLGNVASSP